MNILMRATVLYARVSKDDEVHGDSDSITNQIAILSKYAKEHGYTNIKIFKDDGYTGTNFNRPGFQQIYSLVKSGQVERIIVKDFSRLGRNYIETGRYIDLEFPRFNVNFIAVNNNFTSNGGDMFLAAVWNLINELYAMDISNKQKASLRARSLRGDHITSKILFGYKRNPDKKNHWLIDEEAAKTVRIIFEKYIAGERIVDICAFLEKNKFLSPSNHNNNVVNGSHAVANKYYWCTSSIVNILERQEYCGDTVNFKTYHLSFKDKHVKRNDKKDYVIIRDTQEPVISRKTYELAQKRRESKKRVLTERKYHMLDGLVYCGQCKNKLYINKRTSKKNGNYYIYLCNSYKKKSLCSAHYVTEEKLVNIVIAAVESLLKKFEKDDKIEFRRFVSKTITERTSGNIKEVRKRLSEIKIKLDKIAETEKNLYMEKMNETIDSDTFNQITYTFNKEAEQLNDEYGQLTLILNKVEDNKSAIDDFVKKVEMYAGSMNESNKGFIVHQLIDHIEVNEMKKTDKKDSEITVKIFFSGVGILF